MPVNHFVLIFNLEQSNSIHEIVVDTYLHRLNSPLTCHVFGLLIEDGKIIENYIDSKPKWMLKFEDGHQVIPENFQSYMLSQSYLKEVCKNPKQFEIVLSNPSDDWKEVIPHENLRPDTYHQFTELKSKGPFSHLLYMHFPNGGIHGLKVF